MILKLQLTILFIKTEHFNDNHIVVLSLWKDVHSIYEV